MSSFLHRITERNSLQERSSSASANSLAAWMKELRNTKVDRGEMNKLVMNYLTMEGFKEAAEKFRLESGVDHCHPLDVLDERIRIREAVENGNIDDAIDLTNSLNPDILDCNMHLFFHLQQQKLIEHIRDKDIEKALVFSQNVMAEIGNDGSKFLEELEKTMALLAFENPDSSPFGELLDLSHRQVVASELNAAILESQHQETSPKLANVLKLLLWTQNELDKKHVKYPKMTDLTKGSIKSSIDDKITTITIT